MKKRLISIFVTAAMVLSMIVATIPSAGATACSNASDWENAPDWCNCVIECDDSPTPTQPGDFADVHDAIAILRDVIELPQSVACPETHDFNSNGSLDVGDAILVLRGLLGLGEQQVVGDNGSREVEPELEPEPNPESEPEPEPTPEPKISPSLLELIATAEEGDIIPFAIIPSTLANSPLSGNTFNRDYDLVHAFANHFIEPDCMRVVPLASLRVVLVESTLEAIHRYAQMDEVRLVTTSVFSREIECVNNRCPEDCCLPFCGTPFLCDCEQPKWFFPTERCCECGATCNCRTPEPEPTAPEPTTFASAREVLDLSDAELRAIALGRQQVNLNLHTFDDFGVPLLPGETLHTWWMNSADSLEEAKASAARFNIAPDRTPQNVIELLGENDFYYVLRLTQTHDFSGNGFGYPDDGSNIDTRIWRIIVYKDSVFHNRFADGRDIRYQFRTNDFDSMLILLDLHFFGSAEFGQSRPIYREFAETDTRFIYTWYSLRMFSYDDEWCGITSATLLKNEVAVDKATGLFIDPATNAPYVSGENGHGVTTAEIRTFATSNRPTEPTEPMTPLSDELRQRINADLAEFVNPYGSDCCCFSQTDLGIYLGTYNGNVAFLYFPGISLPATRSERVGDYVFHYANFNYSVSVWSDGVIHRLASGAFWCAESNDWVLTPGAYELGVLSDSDVNDVLFYFQRYYPRRFGCRNHGMRDCPECAYWVD